MSRDDAGTDLGKIKIHRNVIASITSIAALQTEGVKAIGKSLSFKFRELLEKKELSED